MAKTTTPSNIPEVPEQNMSVAPNQSVPKNMSTPLGAVNVAPPQQGMSVPPRNQSVAPNQSIPKAPTPAQPPAAPQPPQQKAEVAAEQPKRDTFTMTGNKIDVVKNGKTVSIDEGALEMYQKAGYSIPAMVEEEPIAEEAPTVAESTTKVNADGSTTAETKDYSTPEAQEYKKQLDDAMQSVDAEVQYAKSKFSAISAAANDAQKNLMIAIEKTFEVRKAEMERINKAALNTQKLLGARGGRQRYAPEMQASILSEEERSGLVRFTEIEALEYQTIAAAQKAATDEDLAILSQQMNTLRDLRAEKNDIISNMYNVAVKEEQRAQTRAMFAIEHEKTILDIQAHKQEKVQTYANALGSNLVGLDENFNVIEATAEEVIEIAKDAGVDPNLVFASMNEQAAKLRAESREERGTFFERQKFAESQAQNEFKNYMDTQKFQMESQVFGYTIEEARLKNQKLQAELYGTDVSSEAADWADLIIKGQMKMSDVPNELKTDVAKALAKRPPDPKDIRKAKNKIKELDDILTHKGMDESVGATKLTRLDLWRFSGAKQDFIGSVQELLSEKTLQSLIDAKADGATFGALSEGELRILEQAATKIGQWAIRNEEGDVVGYKIDEKSFKEEVRKIKGEYETLVNDIEEKMPFKPFTNYEDFYQRRTPEQKALYEKYDSDPALQDASVEDLLQQVNSYYGFDEEKGGAELLTFSARENFPPGSKGGQCGTFAHKLVEFPPVGDLKEQKFASVNKFGMKKENWKPQVGDVVITNEHPKWGHVLVLGEQVAPGKYKAIESNYKGDERVSYDRVIDVNSPKIYGAIRGQYKV